MYSRKISAGYDCMIHDNKQIGKSFSCSWVDLRLQKENLVKSIFVCKLPLGL